MGGTFPPRVFGRVRGKVMVGGDCGAEGRRLYVSSTLYISTVVVQPAGVSVEGIGGGRGSALDIHAWA